MRIAFLILTILIQPAIAQGQEDLAICLERTTKLPFQSFKVVAKKILVSQPELSRDQAFQIIKKRLAYLYYRDSFMIFANSERFHSDTGAVTGNIASLRNGLCACEKQAELENDITTIRKHLLQTVLIEEDDFTIRSLKADDLACSN